MLLERPARHRAGTGDAPRPLRLSRRIADQILAYLDLHVRQTARLAVTRNGVVGLVADEVRLIVRRRRDRASRRSMSSTRPAKRRSRLYSTAACISRRTPLKILVMLCWATRMVGRPAGRSFIEQRAQIDRDRDRRSRRGARPFHRPAQADVAGDLDRLAQPWGSMWRPSGSRLQSITRRE